jgi:hypothetical protein
MADFDFNINWNLLVNRNLPLSKRNGVIFFDWVRSSIKALKNTYAVFLDDVQRVRIDLTFSAKTMSLERKLNTLFLGHDQWSSPTYPNAEIVDAAGGIWIDNSANHIPTTYLFNQTENQPAPFLYDEGESVPDQLYIYDESEYALQYDFIVNVPSWWLAAQGITLSDFEPMARQVIDRYRRAGTRYNFLAY